MTNPMTKSVANKLLRFGADSLRNAEYNALTIFRLNFFYIY
jgi:hypothetical protein